MRKIILILGAVAAIFLVGLFLVKANNFLGGTLGINQGKVSASTCDTTTVADNDGNVYGTKQVGTQCWMRENINVGKKIDISSSQSDNGVIERYCRGDLDSNCSQPSLMYGPPHEPMGGSYGLNEAMQYSTQAGARGICPVGWHIPTTAEFQTLQNYVLQAVGISSIGQANEDTKVKLRELDLAELFGNVTSQGGYDFLGDFYGFSHGLWSSTPSPLACDDLGCHKYDPFKVVRTDFDSARAVRCVKD